jgi:DNA-binding transcriptional regulator YbjK
VAATGGASRAATAKGAARREAIVAAAARLVATKGPDGTSHRAVATAAGVPLAATTYYFRSLDDLLVAAVERAADDELSPVTELVAALPRRRTSADRVAGIVLDIVLGPDRLEDADLQTHYERFLAGGRHPALRPVLQQTRRRVDALLTEALDRCGHAEADTAQLVAVLDGTVISALVEGDGRARVRARAAVAALLESDSSARRLLKK